MYLFHTNFLTDTHKSDVQAAAWQYFQRDLPGKIVVKLCRQHPEIIKVTEFLLDGLLTQWKSEHTTNALCMFWKISNLWFEELKEDPLVSLLIGEQGGLKASVVSANREYFYFLQLSNFLLDPFPFAAFVAFKYTDCKFFS